VQAQVAELKQSVEALKARPTIRTAAQELELAQLRVAELNKELDAAANQSDIDAVEAKLKAYTVEHAWKNWQITSLYGAQVGERINNLRKSLA
jgi:hypothetical protein